MLRLPQMRRFFLSSANAEDEKTKKKKGGSKSRTRDLNFADHRSTHYSIPPSLESKLKIVYIHCKKSQNIFFDLEKKIIK